MGEKVERVEDRLADLTRDKRVLAAADTREEALELIQEAIEFHIEGLREDGQPVPEPTSSIEYVEVRAA